jgi:predicted metal-dependent peptidase
MNLLNGPEERLRAARSSLLMDHFFFGSLALRLKLQPESRGRTRTIATDGCSIFYHGEYVQGCSDVELIGVVAHEVLHPALLHHTRRGDRDPKLWNDAADYAVNLILRDAGFTLPAGTLFDPKYRGMSAERIYDALHQPSEGEKGEDEQVSLAGSDAPTDDGGDAGDGDDGTGEGDNTGDNPGDDDELADKPGAVFDAPEPQRQEAEWQVAVKQAMQFAQMMGQMPGDIKVAVEEALRPRIPWTAILRRFVQQLASADYSWRMPNRRYLSSGVYVPEIRSEAMPAIVVAVDSSASTERVLPVFKAELQSIVDECQPEATIVIMADAAVQRVDRFERGEPIQFNVEGLGGTDFRPTFLHVDREQWNPACLIYLTDGDGCYPDQPSDYPTLWAITDPHCQAPWGETVTVDAATP